MQVSPDASTIFGQEQCKQLITEMGAFIADYALGVPNLEKMLLRIKRSTTFASQVMVGMTLTHLDT